MSESLSRIAFQLQETAQSINPRIARVDHTVALHLATHYGNEFLPEGTWEQMYRAVSALHENNRHEDVIDFFDALSTNLNISMRSSEYPVYIRLLFTLRDSRYALDNAKGAQSISSSAVMWAMFDEDGEFTDITQLYDDDLIQELLFEFVRTLHLIEVDEAEELKALQLALSRLADPVSLSIAAHRMGKIFFNQEDFSKSFTHAQQSLKFAEEAKDYWEIEKAIRLLSDLFEVAGDPSRQAGILIEGLHKMPLTTESGFNEHMAVYRLKFRLAELNEGAGQIANAKSLFLQAAEHLEMAQEVESAQELRDRATQL
ncbi:hypothetical protein QP027_11060 [Corynebacterium breve]|uniref:Tetratricopeptide repeat protein n=1 Tax=Corynebacterium breve TaxID=3049799 RepID=A0ABY8VH69_9CORY|nr:hypothetical protein [Corynebacterium breve]WIM67608.1 hypothetical protein QP027_11060 [Corynebacterium breve]